MYRLERTCKALRHSALLKHAAPVWALVRPAYNTFLGIFGKGGLTRNINGTDVICVVPELRGVPEYYEPEVWAMLMKMAAPGTKVIDVGAHVGLYAVAFAKRVGPSGVVLAAEPDPENIALLTRQVALNNVQSTVQIVPAALSDGEGSAVLAARGIESRVTESDAWSDTTLAVKLQTLDTVTDGSHWDILLIDVEGFEEKVLRGGRQLLADTRRRPHTILVEVHPYVWSELGVSSDSLLGELQQHGYCITHLDRTPVSTIHTYGHIIATAPVSR